MIMRTFGELQRGDVVWHKNAWRRITQVTLKTSQSTEVLLTGCLLPVKFNGLVKCQL